MSLTTAYLVLGQAANIVGILLVTPISRIIGKKKTFLYAMLSATILSICFFFAEKDNLMTMLILQILISICAGSIFPLLWSMYGDIADYSELKTGRRATGLIFSSSSMSQKFGWTLGGALTGWLLAYYGFEANMEQTTDTQDGIKLMLSIFPAIGGLISVICISLYPLTEAKIKEISTRLEELRNIDNK